MLIEKELMISTYLKWERWIWDELLNEWEWDYIHLPLNIYKGTEINSWNNRKTQLIFYVNRLYSST